MSCNWDGERERAVRMGEWSTKVWWMKEWDMEPVFREVWGGNWCRQFRIMMKTVLPHKEALFQGTFPLSYILEKSIFSLVSLLRLKQIGWACFGQMVKVYPWKGRMGSMAPRSHGQFIWLTVQRLGFVLCIGPLPLCVYPEKITLLHYWAADNVVNGLRHI